MGFAARQWFDALPVVMNEIIVFRAVDLLHERAGIFGRGQSATGGGKKQAKSGAEPRHVHHRARDLHEVGVGRAVQNHFEPTGKIAAASEQAQAVVPPGRGFLNG